MAPEPIDVAIVGYGLAGSAFHAPLVDALEDYRLATIVTKNAERARDAVERYPHVRVVDSLEDVWPTNPDLLVIATPNTLHAPMAHEAIDHGVTAVVDKPMALSSAEGLDVVEHAEQADVIVTAYQNRRWDGDFLTVADLIDSGSLGDIARFESRFERWRPNLSGGWRETISPAEGGGLLFDLGAHVIDQACVLFGPPTHVYAEVDVTRKDASTDDDVFVALTHANNVRSHLFMSAAAPDLGPRFRILGNDAGYVTFGLDPQEAALRAGQIPGTDGWGLEPETDWGYLVRGDVREPVPTIAGNYPSFYRQLAAAIRGEAAVPVDPTDAVRTLRIIEAARESSLTNSTISL